MARLGDEDLLEGLELLHAPARADGHGVQRVVGDVDRHRGLVPEVHCWTVGSNNQYFEKSTNWLIKSTPSTIISDHNTNTKELTSFSSPNDDVRDVPVQYNYDTTKRFT